MAFIVLPGADASGNGNDWTANNINNTDSTAATYDIMTDVPTLTDEDTANYAVLNPINKTGGTLSQANLYYYGGAGPTSYVAMSTIGMTEGKFYAEWLFESGSYCDVGICRANVNLSDYLGADANGWMYYNGDGNKYTNGTGVAYGATYTGGDIIGIAFDADIGTLTFYKNGVSQGAAFTGLTDGPYFFAIGSFTTYGYFNFGQQPFAYTPPAGYLKLNTFNLPDSSIVEGSEYFDTVLYTGNGTSQTITGVEFAPDFVWLKNRTDGYNPGLWDTIRGATNTIYSSLANAEGVESGLSAFGTNGFTVGSALGFNKLADAFVSWNWKAGGTAVSNTAGSITSSVSANPTAGFSVVTYTGSGANATVGHGLGAAPNLMIVKSRTTANNWFVYHHDVGATKYLNLNSVAAEGTSSTVWNDTEPTSSVFSVGTASINGSGNDVVAYCFAEVEGYSKFGSLTMNGTTDNAFVYTGFKPAFVLVKRTDAVSSWNMWDSARDPYNTNQYMLRANDPAAETVGGADFDFVSNGFKVRYTGSGTYIYMAFAENPFKNSLAR